MDVHYLMWILIRHTHLFSISCDLLANSLLKKSRIFKGRAKQDSLDKCFTIKNKLTFICKSLHTVNNSLYDGCPFGLGTNGKA